MVVSTTCDKERVIANPNIVYVSPEQKILVDLISCNLVKVCKISEELSYSCLLKALRQYLDLRGFSCFLEGRSLDKDITIKIDCSEDQCIDFEEGETTAEQKIYGKFFTILKERAEYERRKRRILDLQEPAL